MGDPALALAGRAFFDVGRRMNRLGKKIAGLIRATGPISVADYMATCLFDPDDGYYTTREPFGAAGDFVTAPEISQMFGELVAVWLVQAWHAVGSPSPVTVAEIGPGRGTLMKDVARTIHRLAPELAAAADFALIEASPRLAQVQRATLEAAGVTATWHETIGTLKNQPLIIVGNEIFDALPFRQFVRTGGKWLERAVGLDGKEALAFGVGSVTLAANAVPVELATVPDGTIFEVAPARDALMAVIAERIAGRGGAGLFFDYGHLAPGAGDTFQAIRRHHSEGVLDNPGEADLTSHVDFSTLAVVARAYGLEAPATTQGAFLLAMGLLERAGRLGQTGDETAREKIAADVERLAGPEQMGSLFKAIALLPAGVAMPPFATARSHPVS